MWYYTIYNQCLHEEYCVTSNFCNDNATYGASQILQYGNVDILKEHDCVQLQSVNCILVGGHSGTQDIEDWLVPKLRGYNSHTEPAGSMLVSEISVPALMYHVFDVYGGPLKYTLLFFQICKRLRI